METDLAEKLRLLDRLLIATRNSSGWIIEKYDSATFVVRDDNRRVLGTSPSLHEALDLATTGIVAQARRVLAAAPDEGETTVVHSDGSVTGPLPLDTRKIR